MTARQSACGQSAANERKDVSLSGQKRLHFFHPEAHQDTKIICFLDWTQFGIWGGMGFFIPMCSIPRLCVGAMKQIWSGIEVQRLHQNSLWEAQCSTDMNAIFLPVLKQALHLFVHFSFKFKNCRKKMMPPSKFRGSSLQNIFSLFTIMYNVPPQLTTIVINHWKTDVVPCRLP